MFADAESLMIPQVRPVTAGNFVTGAAGLSALIISQRCAGIKGQGKQDAGKAGELRIPACVTAFQGGFESLFRLAS